MYAAANSRGPHTAGESGRREGQAYSTTIRGCRQTTEGRMLFFLELPCSFKALQIFQLKIGEAAHLLDDLQSQLRIRDEQITKLNRQCSLLHVELGRLEKSFYFKLKSILAKKTTRNYTTTHKAGIFYRYKVTEYLCLPS